MSGDSLQTGEEEEYRLPECCPDCGAPTEIDGGSVRCTGLGFTCPAQAVERLRCVGYSVGYCMLGS